jgi:hypothetical protein
MEENQPGEKERCTVASNEVRTSAVSTGVGSLSVTGVSKPTWGKSWRGSLKQVLSPAFLWLIGTKFLVDQHPFEPHCSDVIKHTFDRLKDPPADHLPTLMIGH